MVEKYILNFLFSQICMTLVFVLAIMHHIGRSVGVDCDCSDIHTCEMLVQGAGNKFYL